MGQQQRLHLKQKGHIILYYIAIYVDHKQRGEIFHKIDNINLMNSKKCNFFLSFGRTVKNSKMIFYSVTLIILHKAESEISGDSRMRRKGHTSLKITRNLA